MLTNLTKMNHTFKKFINLVIYTRSVVFVQELYVKRWLSHKFASGFLLLFNTHLPRCSSRYPSQLCQNYTSFITRNQMTFLICIYLAAYIKLKGLLILTNRGKERNIQPAKAILCFACSTSGHRTPARVNTSD